MVFEEVSMQCAPLLQEQSDIIFRIINIIKGLRELKSLDSILDRLLLEARRLVGADAGTIFLVEGRELVFSYVHNDSLFSAAAVNRHIYLDARLPIDGTSLAGHVARTGQIMVIEDAYAIDPSLCVTFNASFDERTGYRTRAVAVLPLVSSRGRTIAVMQLLNPMNPAGDPVTFDERHVYCLNLLADQAAAAVEVGLVTEEFILRMSRMAELRDPAETATHVRRVGAYCAELYHTIVGRGDLPERELKRRKDMMRIAAMMHDVGKVGISDAILGKPGPLTAEEYRIMQRHTILGAGLFDSPSSEMDAWARDVALHHHQRYDGKGYPVTGEAPPGCGSLAGEDIPLAARITAVADVYDALVSKRVYKPPMSHEEACEILRQGAGSHFDPVVVEAFFSIQDVVQAIRDKYAD